MKRFSIIICLLCAIISNMCAQHISRRYHDRSMSDVLIDLDKSSSRYKISFIYNELEDFTVTQNVNEQNIPNAIRRVIGFYPMKMTVGDSLITVECTFVLFQTHNFDRHTKALPYSYIKIVIL